MTITMELLTQKNRNEPICDRCHQPISFNAPYCLYSNGWKEHGVACPKTDEHREVWINEQMDKARFLANLPAQRFGLKINPEVLNQKVTVIINNRNWLTYPKKMVEVIKT